MTNVNNSHLSICSISTLNTKQQSALDFITQTKKGHIELK